MRHYVSLGWVIVTAVLLMAAGEVSAAATNYNLKSLTTTFTPAGTNTAGATTQYTFKGKVPQSSTDLSQITAGKLLTYTFPAGTDVSGCTGADFNLLKNNGTIQTSTTTPADFTLTINAAARTISFNAPITIPSNSSFNAVFRGIKNPPTTGSFSTSLVAQNLSNGVNRATFTYTINPGVPDHLEFLVQPSDIEAGATINPLVKVVIKDALGNTVVSATNTINLATTPTSTMSGNSVAAVAGIATFTSLTVTTPLGNYTLTATCPSLTLATPSTVSGSFNVNAATSNRLKFVTASAKLQPLPNPLTAGSAFSPVIEVQVQDANGNPVATQKPITLTLIDKNGQQVTGNPNFPVTVTSDTSGKATFTGLTVTLVDTGYTLSASVIGESLVPDNTLAFDVTHAAADHFGFSINPTDTIADNATSNTTPIADYEVSIYDLYNNLVTSGTGSTLSVTVSITPPNTPGGTLTVLAPATLTVAATGGKATFTDTFIDKSGQYTLTASGTVTSGVSNTFNILPGAATKLTFTGLTSPVNIGGAYPFTVTALDAFNNVDTNFVGNVTFSSATDPLIAFLPTSYQFLAGDQGTKTFNNNGVTFNTLGSQTATASSTGLTAGSQTVTVQKATSTTTAITSRNYSPANTLVTFTATVGYPNNGPVPTNSITFTIKDSGNTTILTQTVAVAGAAASLDYTFTAAGSYTVTAQYNGDSNYNGSTASLTQFVTANTSTVSLSVPASTVYGETATFQVTVTSTPTTPPIDGDVIIREGTTELARVTLAAVGVGVTQNVVNLNTSALVVGNHTITAEYIGSPSFSQAQDSKAFTVNKASTSIAVASTPNASTFGDQVTFSATVSASSPGSGTPTGNIDFVIDGVTHTVALSGGSATYQTSTLGANAAGYSFVVNYAGDSNFSGSTKTGTNQVVNKAATTTVLISGANPSVYGNAVTFTATVNSAAGTPSDVADSVDFVLDNGTPVNKPLVAGEATFTTAANLSVGTHTVVASYVTSTNYLASTSNTITQSVTQTAAKVVISTQPVNTVSGGTITVVAEVQDASGNVVTGFTSNVQIAIQSGTVGATLSGTTTKAAVAGVATFNDLSIDKAGTYTLLVSSGVLTTDESDPFDITVGNASQLVITTQPASTTSGSTITVVAEIRDSGGNVVTTANNSVGIAIKTGTGTGTLSGTTPVSPTNGVVTFNDLSIDKAGTGYKLTLTPSGLTAVDSNAFNITHGTASQIVITTQPGNSTAGNTFTVVAELRDAAGNVVTTGSSNLAIALSNNPSGATLSGTSPVATSSGVATFNDLSLDKSGTGYKLSVSTGMLSVETNAFNVTSGNVAALVITTQPQGTTSGGAIGMVVELRDSLNNVVNVADAVQLTIVTPNGATLSGTTSVNAVAGVATFSNLSIDKAGSYQLRATSGSHFVDSNSITITAGAADHLTITTQPSGGVSGSQFTVVAEIRDAAENVTSATTSVAVAIANNAGNGTLSGTTPVNAVAGVVTFSNLSIDKVGTGYTLTLTAGALTATTNGFNITHDVASQLVVVTQPLDTTSGAAITVSAELRDAAGNVATSSNANVSVAIANNAGGGTLSGTTTVAAASGVATFSNLSIDKAGTGYTLQLTSGALNTTTNAFDIGAAAAAKLAFTVQPGNTEAGVAITPAIVVTVQDAAGNTITSASDSITVSLTNAGTAVLNGAKTLNAVSGVATFSDLSVVGTGDFTLTAIATNLAVATSGTFTVSDTVPPSFTSQPTISTTNPLVDVPVTFTASATDVQSVTYTWNFGDGTIITTSSTSIDHTFTIPGPVTVSVTVTDASGLTSTFSMQLVVAVSATPDTDICAGLNPIAYTTLAVGAKLKFPGTLLKDSVSLKAVVNLNNGFNPLGQEVKWDIAGIRSQVNLDAKGNSPKSTTVKVSLRYKKPKTGEAFTARPGKLAISMKGQNLSALKLANVTTLNADTPKTGTATTAHVCVVLTNHRAYEADRQGIYKAKVGKTGSYKSNK